MQTEKAREQLAQLDVAAAPTPADAAGAGDGAGMEAPDKNAMVGPVVGGVAVP